MKKDYIQNREFVNSVIRIKSATTGITLVALVISIIVLLILAGVAVVSLTGDNGIIKKAQEAKEKTEQGAKTEEETIKNLLETMNQLQGGSPEGVKPSIELPKTEETTPYLPEDKFTQLPGTDLNTGLVVTDGTNEYVWVEVPKNTTASASTPTEIETSLQKYAATYRSEYLDIWYAGCGIESQADYDTLKNKMLTSIKTYGGFWIGRYEAGTEDNSIRANNSSYETNFVSAQDRYPYNWVSCKYAQKKCNSKSASNYTSSLLFGIQWDLTCKYLETKGINQATIKTDSTSVGNYKNASFTITRGEYSLDRGESYTKVSGTYIKAEDSGVMLTTGASERNKTMNIYDLAGNEWEWTLEGRSRLWYTFRGGSFPYYGDTNMLEGDYFSSTYAEVAFRQTLYK